MLVNLVLLLDLLVLSKSKDVIRITFVSMESLHNLQSFFGSFSRNHCVSGPSAFPLLFSIKNRENLHQRGDSGIHSIPSAQKNAGMA